jgi:A/G-specific adenine glycosylase
MSRPRGARAGERGAGGSTPAGLRGKLLSWFDRERRDLPWRRTKDPYAIWISEVMLQQTQVVTVIPYWERFLQRFPTVNALAEAPLPDVLAHWRGLGYYSRARNLHRAAQLIAARGGVLPSTAAELAELPGFGRYTAGAVASIAFGEQAPLVDGNVARVFSRLFEVEGAPGDRAREARLWELAAQCVRGDRPGDWNQALMELGALICRSDAPLCLLCPLRDDCGAQRAGRVDELPARRERAPRKPLRLAVAVWQRGEKVLLGRRAEKGLFGGLWDLPCHELAPGANAAAALQAALEKNGQVGKSLGSVKRTLTHRDLELHLFEVDGASSPKELLGYGELRWASLEQARELGMSTAMDRALALAMGRDRS